MKIRGAQLRDGSFWPYVTLEVGKGRTGQWKSIDGGHREGTEISMTVPASISVFGPRVDFRPLLPFVESMGWGRVNYRAATLP